MALRFTACCQIRRNADVFENVKSGLLSGMSFGMRCVDDSWADGSDPEKQTRKFPSEP